jgi:hypothetical protein
MRLVSVLLAVAAIGCSWIGHSAAPSPPASQRESEVALRRCSFAQALDTLAVLHLVIEPKSAARASPGILLFAVRSGHPDSLVASPPLGHLDLPPVAAGTYRLRVSAIGFRPAGYGFRAKSGDVLCLTAEMVPALQEEQWIRQQATANRARRRAAPRPSLY